MTSENIYPLIVSEQETKLYIDKMVDKNVNEFRIKEMMSQKMSLEKDLHRYKKLLRRWKKADAILTIGGVMSLGLNEILIIGIPFAGVAPIFLPILGVVGIAEAILFSGLVMGLTNKKKTFYLKKCKIIQSYIDKTYYYIEKAREDQIITYEELIGFRKIMDDYRMELQGLQSPSLDIDKLKKTVEKEAKKEIQLEMKESLKQELLSKYHVQNQRQEEKK